MSNELHDLVDDFAVKLKADPNVTPERLQKVLVRAALQVRNADVAVAMPVYREIGVRTAIGLADLVHVAGLQPLIQQGFEVACSREYLVDLAIKLGFKRLLFLDSDTYIGLAGYARLSEMMDRHRPAVLGAIVRRRGAPGAPLATNAFLGTTGDMRPVIDDDIPSTLVPFPVHYVGLAAALLDLAQIGQFPGPRFARRAEGYDMMSENWLFARWCEAHELDVLADPAVVTEHWIDTAHTWEPPKR